MHWKLFPLSLCLTASAWAANPASSAFPQDLASFYGTTPSLYTKKLLPAAKLLKKGGDKNLNSVIARGDLADYALFLLAKSYAAKDQHQKSLQLLDTLTNDYPLSPISDEAKVLKNDETFALGMQESKTNSTKAIRDLTRALETLAWKEWDDHEDAVETLLHLLQKTKSDVADPFLSEVLLALPQNSALRSKLTDDMENKEIRAHQQLAKFRALPSPPGIKPVSPDTDAIEQATAKVLDKNWKGALSDFKKFQEQFPQSEHMDRASFWIARCNSALGNKEDAEKIYKDLWQRYPLSYYGLESAIALGKNPTELVQPGRPEYWPLLEGALLPRQYISLWRIRALLEVGLVDFARAEAEALYNYRPSNALFGQNDPSAALALAHLYAATSFYLGSSPNVYTAMTLDPKLLSNFGLNILFPKAFWDEFNAATDESNVNPLLLLALTKQESAFNPNALSHSDAFGLMQLLPSTARTEGNVKKKRDLFDPRFNTRLGAKYLRGLLDQYKGNIALALAAYNAGPTRVNQWLKNIQDKELFKDGFDVDAFIDSIPYAETHKYVGSILRNYAWYKLINKENANITSVKELAFQWQKNLPLPSPSPTPTAAPSPSPSPQPIISSPSPSPATKP